MNGWMSCLYVILWTQVCGLKWSPDRQQLASGGNDNKLFVWNLRSNNPVQTYSEHMAAVKAIAWSPHQHGLLASGGGTADRRIRFWNTITGRPLQCVDTGSQVCNLAWSKHSNELVHTFCLCVGPMYRQEHSALLHLCQSVFPHVKPPWQPLNRFHLLLLTSGMHCRIICRPFQLFLLLEELSNIAYSSSLTLTVVQNLVRSNQLNVSRFVIQRQLLPSHSPEIPCRPSKGVPSERLRLVEVINFA